MNILVTCEHGGNQVPEAYQKLFRGSDSVLKSHRGWDPGAHVMAHQIAKALSLPIFDSQITRLLIELNRSLNHPQLFSEFSKVLPVAEQEIIIDQFYRPYRNAVEDHIRTCNHPVVHLAIHSFTPILHGEVRSTDIGLLFDPSRNFESSFCYQLKEKLKITLPKNQIDFNKPYLGTDDGFTTYLRTKFPDNHYAGIEIEVNQKLVENAPTLNGLINSLRLVCAK